MYYCWQTQGRKDLALVDRQNGRMTQKRKQQVHRTVRKDLCIIFPVFLERYVKIFAIFLLFSLLFFHNKYFLFLSRNNTIWDLWLLGSGKKYRRYVLDLRKRRKSIKLSITTLSFFYIFILWKDRRALILVQ